MVEWLEYVIKPSNYISSLCYSVFRLEPFTTCSYGCAYCYAQWYRGPHGVPREKPWVPRGFERIARRLPRGLPKPFFRLATLSDPFQPVRGGVSALVKRILRIAHRYEVPLVVNTKGLVARDEEALWLLVGLADRGLLVLQYTIGFGDSVASLLEPMAPRPSERLYEARMLARQGVPVIARVQPLVPGLEQEHYRVAIRALGSGARGLIGEPLRETRTGLARLYKLLASSEEPPSCWEPYQLGEEPGREPLLHPCPEWRKRVNHALEAIAAQHGAVYASCKDSLLTLHKWYRPGKTCCLEWLGLREEPLLRPTLHEYSYLEWPRLSPEQLCKELGPPFICDHRLDQYPAVIRKGVRAHLAKLKKLLRDRNRVQKLLEKLST